MTAKTANSSPMGVAKKVRNSSQIFAFWASR